MSRCSDTNAAQTSFEVTHRFVSACVHCGKPMASMSISRYDREPGPMGAMFIADVYKMWIDPAHDCTYLSIDAKDKAISA